MNITTFGLGSVLDDVSATFFSNTYNDYLLAIGILICALVALRIFKFIVIGKLKQYSKMTKTDMDDLLIQIIDHIGWPFYMLISVYLSLKVLVVPQLIITIFDSLLFLGIVYYIIKTFNEVIEFLGNKVIESNKHEDKGFDPSVVNLLKKISKFVVLILTAVFLISNYGFDISALIAGLGVGGIAIAFALQSILSDVFAYFTIQFDRPFKVGDYVVVGQDSGTVKKIGLKSTRIQTLQGQELIVSNKELTETRVNNFKRMNKRRIEFNIGVTYDTSYAKLEKIPGIVKKIIQNVDMVKFDRTHFHKYGDFSLIYTIVYNIESNNYNVYMDIQQKINLAIKKEFDKQKIGMAFPTQTIHLKK